MNYSKTMIDGFASSKDDAELQEFKGLQEVGQAAAQKNEISTQPENVENGLAKLPKLPKLRVSKFFNN
jgi:hypothetical protein